MLLKIVAEGIETIEQYDLIKSLGCNEIQGYYFSKPCEANKIIELFNENFIVSAY
ncbi:EAL domain-containing protein [Clostridium grantii]|uniref:EAL domain-containing protein n=1 Tax=Clostridium grantii DSM 8605 TaxID=1121316 RepID=A0A1M5S973_9CLOT|nr:EAL domain-containing protein [Clostridium grantii]SHH35034.1 EAL domain-containing protein [Clostridium grantii DSM 8605]